MKSFRLGLILFALAALARETEARLARLDIEKRELLLAGKPFGLAGPYEKLVGTAVFALDPALPQNQVIVDLPLAARNERGEVEFSADFYLLKPVDMRRGNGRLVYEVPNRGGKSILRTLQGAQGSLDPTTEAELGDGWLMRQGFAVVWMGWQWDVPERPGLLRLRAPIATENGQPITGLVRANIILPERAATASLADRSHLAYPALDATDPENTLTVRSHRLDAPQPVARSQWRFDSPTTVALDGGFEPGKIYDVVYRARDPRVAGTSLSATRDLVSFFKYRAEEGNPLAGVSRALAIGVSQSGRFLRHFLYQDFNQDEEGKRVFDGVFVQVAGAGRGSFNHRFAQASRDGYRHLNLFYPTDLFPFTDLPQTDSEAGVTDGLLVKSLGSGTVPKLFHVLSSFEYWNRAGSLIHTDPEGRRDAEIPETSRVYLIASAQHGPGSFPPEPGGTEANRGQAPSNPNNFAPAIRALFHALDRWVVGDIAPPPSAYPKLVDGTLNTPSAASWPAIPEAPFPLILNDAHRVDYGPDWQRGIVSLEPPRVGRAFGARVPQVGADGNEIAGIRMPEIEFPLATHTGWNFRHPDTGAPDELVGVLGSYFPLPRTRAAREALGDPRESIEERYRDRDHYLGKIAGAALRLVEKRYLLVEDLPEVIGRAARHYDWLMGASATSGNARSGANR
jgi:hypothetical protein